MNLGTINREIANKKKEIEKLEMERQRIEVEIEMAQAFINGLQRAIQLLPRDLAEGKKPEEILRANSDPAKAREAILAAGKPLYIAEILSQLKIEDSKESRVSVSGSLGAYARKGEIFVKVAPRTFGLVELGHNQLNASQDTASDDEEPPADFGGGYPVFPVDDYDDVDPFE